MAHVAGADSLPLVEEDIQSAAEATAESRQGKQSLSQFVTELCSQLDVRPACV